MDGKHAKNCLQFQQRRKSIEKHPCYHMSYEVYIGVSAEVHRSLALSSYRLALKLMSQTCLLDPSCNFCLQILDC